ncbi:MAG: DUF2800 domain-containing protein [Negativicutes bacterium]|nr:DUF2800 domain-containing protein [Negativicutes bacterium]
MTDLTTHGHERPAHSRLGASGAERWMKCTLSVAKLPVELQPIDKELDDPDFRRAGAASHAAIHRAILSGEDGWELIGETIEGWEIDGPMSASIQTYLDECRKLKAGASQWGVEQAIDAPDFHPEFYGTTDFWAITGDGNCLAIRDYKNGVGIVVEVENNPQLWYYAYGILRRLPNVELVDIGIVQPNVSWHPDGVIRRQVVQASDIFEWAECTLLPAMRHADEVTEAQPGEWCRFCPRKLICPVLKGMYAAAARADVSDLSLLTDEQLGQEWSVLAANQAYVKAIKEETLRRHLSGHTVPGTKLVAQKSNRVWRDNPEEIFFPLFGEAIYKPREILSPPGMETLGPNAKELVKEYAYSPGGAPTVALADDRRQSITLTNSLRTAAQKLLDAGG